MHEVSFQNKTKNYTIFSIIFFFLSNFNFLILENLGLLVLKKHLIKKMSLSMQSFPAGGKQLLFNIFNNGNDVYVIPPIQRQIRRPYFLLPSSFRHLLYSFSQISTFNLTLVTQNFSNKSVVTNVF